MLSSTNHFNEKLKQVKVQSHQILVRFDGVSLFTNVPLEETTEIIANHLFYKDNPNIPPIEKHAFIKLMKLATHGMFLYNGELFKEIDGIAVGSPLGPTLADFFLANLENKFSIIPMIFTLKFIYDMWMMLLQFLMTIYR